MEFIGLVLINIFMGALFYFIISLKLEKSASEFRERKLRKEMEAIINEFNSAAERNITILEQKISVIKRLLERSGDIKSFNSVITEDMRHNPDNKIQDNEQNFEEFDNKNNLPEYKIIQKTKERKKDLNYFIDGALNFISSVKDFFSYIRKDPVIEEKFSSEENDFSHYSIEKELKMPIDAEISIIKEVKQDLAPDEQEIIEVFNSVNDKLSLYSAISDLHLRGCGINDLSHYSGLPAGEIKLVLNLQGVKNI
jgi:hypothetical protein